jgi:alanyl-tRNA synthetase
LPRPSIDTGMGLERIAAVVQSKMSNYDTDLFAPLIADVAALARHRYGAAEADDVSMRVIADHARTTTFLIADGVTPSNEWRGYVLRRIMRRAMRHGRMLGLTEPFLWKTVDWVVKLMGEGYPEIVAERPRIQEAIRSEEERFAETLDTGTLKIKDYLAEHGSDTRRVVDGRFLFTLYDTYGFPMDLAEEVFQDAGWRVTEATRAAADAEMEAQRARARAGATFGAADDAAASTVYQRSALEIPSTEFVGYDSLTSPARVLAIVDAGSGARGGSPRRGGCRGRVILDRTPAYAESGGQWATPAPWSAEAVGARSSTPTTAAPR